MGNVTFWSIQKRRSRNIIKSVEFNDILRGSAGKVRKIIEDPLVKQRFGHEHNDTKQENPYGLAKAVKNHCYNNVLSRSIKWQKNKQTRGRRRRTMESPGTPSKTHGETSFRHMVAQAETVVCIGSISVTCEILRVSENRQNHW